MQTPLAARFPLEVLYRVGDIDVSPVYACFIQAFIKQLPSRADKRPTLFIFLVAGLFADQHQRGVQFSPARFSFQFSKHRLRSVTIEVAAVTVLHRFP